MTERLIIRLASEPTQKNHWLIWSETENEIIASGDVENALQLNLLTEKAQNRVLTCVLPGVDINIKSVAIKGHFNRQIQQALPYILEDELAMDVETLHFNVFAKQRDLIHVAYCSHEKMKMWCDWLVQAQLNCLQFIPEGLTLPVAEEGHWSVLAIDDQFIVRENKEIAWSCDASMLNVMLASKNDASASKENAIVMQSYSDATSNYSGNWQVMPAVLPMQLLAMGCINNKVNLLSAEFKVNKQTHQALLRWRFPFVFMLLGLLLMMLNMHMKSVQNEQQLATIKAQVEQVYVQAFPLQKKLSYTRIKKRMKSMLRPINADINSGFLLMLNELVPSFKAYPQMRPSSIKFDAKKQEMQILLSADNFQSFERFIKSLPKNYSVQQGALNNSQDRVFGTLRIRSN
ncbi:general secretion pathway protein L [Psychromonas sp. CNPT3]|uniref:type II secretion system protein GspL n=1 Tax=Psychromonas sp. CNPT3 TaxID=314282 RepID=UPI00006E70A3|nr:type II secretion system protein GspL [Psychromonas sp. CNPT3]AGH80129.1 general secretion pathway protein L [Psychromonas sp. CNPT3]